MLSMLQDVAKEDIGVCLKNVSRSLISSRTIQGNSLIPAGGCGSIDFLGAPWLFAGR
jgi:hypothetical protein